jgi:hypothetical protein
MAVIVEELPEVAPAVTVTAPLLLNAKEAVPAEPDATAVSPAV